MKKPHAGFWLATLGLGVCWLLALLTRDRLNGILLAGAALALIFTPPPAAKARPWLPWVASAWMGFGATAACCTTAGNTACRSGPSRFGSASAAGGIGCWTWSERPLAAGGAGRRRRPLRLRRVLEAGRLAARRATGVHAAAAGGRLVDLSARRQLAAVETTGQLNGGQRPGKIMPQAIAYRLPDRVY